MSVIAEHYRDDGIEVRRFMAPLAINVTEAHTTERMMTAAHLAAWPQVCGALLVMQGSTACKCSAQEL
jgi:hypothetical protein